MPRKYTKKRNTTTTTSTSTSTSAARRLQRNRTLRKNGYRSSSPTPPSSPPPSQRRSRSSNYRYSRMPDSSDAATEGSGTDRSNYSASSGGTTCSVAASRSGPYWRTLEHNGPLFAPPYIRLPKYICFVYNGQPLRLSLRAEEAATFYAKLQMRSNTAKYTKNEIFQRNFFQDFRGAMTATERKRITKFALCDFRHITAHLKYLADQKTKLNEAEKYERKLQLSEERKIFGNCRVDGKLQKLEKFRLEAPGIFIGRGTHPQMGQIKKRIEAEDIIINCSAKAAVPEPPAGHNWQEVRHDPNVLWLAKWIDAISGKSRYLMIHTSAPQRRLNNEAKFNIARSLGNCIETIRAAYEKDWRSADLRVRQRGTALYFIDHLALRIGFDKEEYQAADTVGCCSLRVQHISLIDNRSIKFDFLSKDSVRYFNIVKVPAGVYKNLQEFIMHKRPNEPIFDQLKAKNLNDYLRNLMAGLTSRVFRTYNASKTLQNMLNTQTKENSTLQKKLNVYTKANRAAAVLCNHTRSMSKKVVKSVADIDLFIRSKMNALRNCRTCITYCRNSLSQCALRKNRQKIQQLESEISTLRYSRQSLIRRSTIALHTSKLNYLDPRITVAWCKRHNVPITKIYNNDMIERFKWAMETEADFQF